MPAANSNVPSLAELIREHWSKSTPALYAIIAQHHPAATKSEIISELRRQAAENLAEADRLAMAGPAEGTA